MLNAVIQLPIGFIVALSGALIPGPLFTYIVAKSPAGGAHVGPKAVVGHAIVEISLLVLILLGLGVVFQHQNFQGGMGVLGGCLLLILGALSIKKLNSKRPTSGKTFVRYKPLIGGVVYSSILNPTVPLWWATIGFAMLMDAYAVGAILGVIFWLIGHYLADFGWFSLISFSTARKGKVMSSRGYRRLLMLCAVFLVFFGIYLFVKYSSLLLS